MRAFIVTALLSLLSTAIQASSVQHVEADSVTVCPVHVGTRGVPDFEAPQCFNVNFWDVDPQGRMIWFKGTISLPQAIIETTEPLSVFIEVSAASEVFVNNKRLGSNGIPGYSADDEVPGQISATFLIPPNILKPGDNEITLRMSAHHGALSLRNPMQIVAIRDYIAPEDVVLRDYWTSLLTFGAFVLGTLYFGVASIRGVDRYASMLLCLVCLLAIGQLLAETSRAIIPYTYPDHEVSLLTTVAMSLGIGACLSAYVINKFQNRRRRLAFLVVFGVTLVTVLMVPGFDSKALLSLLIPNVTSMLFAAVAARKGKQQAFSHLIALTVFGILIFVTARTFLSSVFFYTIAGLLVFLFVQQPILLSREQRNRLEEAAKANKLKEALDAATNEQPRQIKVKHVGEVELIDIDTISHCNAARDYVELCFKDGNKTLHNGSLNELEEQLPSTFIRVHRSHIVNTACVRVLKRKSSGVGELHMVGGEMVAVSRRIMPRVRDMLT